MRAENPKDGHSLFGNYLGDFYSEPSAQVQSTVFERQGVLHIYYHLKEGFTLTSISDNFLNEILNFASRNGISSGEFSYVLHNE